MLRSILKSKIQKAVVTETNLEYSGSITIDQEIMEAADIVANEKVLVVNLNNGSRIETYAIPGARGSGVIGMNGGAARHALKGDRLLIMSFVHMETKDALSYGPKIVRLGEGNKPLRNNS